MGYDQYISDAAWPAYYFALHPQKGITICVFLTYQAFKNREGIVSQPNREVRRFDFKMCGVVLFQSQFGNMFFVNGNIFLIFKIYLMHF